MTRIFLDAAFLTRPTSVVGDRRNIFDQLDVQAGRLERGDGALAARTGAFHTHFHVSHAEFGRLFSGLLSGALTGERGALAASLKPSRTGTGPAQRVALGVGNGDRRVIERRVNVDDTTGHVATNFFLLVGLCHGKVLKISVGW
jgi:hypothetical protein